MVQVVVVVGIMVVTEAIMAAAKRATGMVTEVVHTIMVQVPSTLWASREVTTMDM
jgi:hypothetical protein